MVFGATQKSVAIFVPMNSQRLSVKDCRHYLGRIDLSDNEIADLRDTLYGYAEVLIDQYIEAKPNVRKTPEDE